MGNVALIPVFGAVTLLAIVAAALATDSAFATHMWLLAAMAIAVVIISARGVRWDSDGRLARSGGAQADAPDPAAPCTFSFHTAFEDPKTPPDAPDRWSIEVRCIALYA